MNTVNVIEVAEQPLALRIEMVEVVRDEVGGWCHPGFYEGEYLGPDFEAWLVDHHLERKFAWMEADDDAGTLFEKYESAGTYTHWEPERPEGDGWFIGCIYDTEDGPLCIWLRPDLFKPGASTCA